MKLNLLLLVIRFCFIANSLAQIQFYWPFSFDQQHHRHSIWQHNNDHENEDPVRRFSPYLYRNRGGDFHNSNWDTENDEGPNPYEIIGRRKSPSKLGSIQPALVMAQENIQDDANLRRYFTSFNPRRYGATTYETTHRTTTTITSAIVSTCINKIQFIRTNPPNCRRRRNYASFVQDSSQINPSTTIPIETTVIDMAADRKQRSVESSQEVMNFNHPSIVALPSSVHPRFLGFNLWFGTTTTTITIPTSFVIVTTYVTTQLTLGNTSALLCLPSGFNIC